MAGKPRIVFRDGKRWKFTPGEDGSLIEMDARPVRPTLGDVRAKAQMAKTIVAPQVAEEIANEKKKRLLDMKLVQGRKVYSF